MVNIVEIRRQHRPQNNTCLAINRKWNNRIQLKLTLIHIAGQSQITIVVVCERQLIVPVQLIRDKLSNFCDIRHGLISIGGTHKK